MTRNEAAEPGAAGTAGGAPPTDRDVPPTSLAFRVVTLLDLVSRRDKGVGPREAERETGIDRSAVSRIFRQLESLGWLEVVDDRGTYIPGPQLFATAAAVRERDSLWLAAAPLLSHLADLFNETTYVTVRRGQRVVFVHKLDSTQRIRYIVELNEPYPLTTGAAGRAILSAISPTDVDQAIAEGLVGYTPASITDPQEYRAQLDRDARLGYAYSRSGWVPQGAGVASPYFDASGACGGAVTVSAPLDRLTPEKVVEVGPAVREVAHELSVRLGYAGRPWGPSAG